jgi:hypothetical protein
VVTRMSKVNTKRAALAATVAVISAAGALCLQALGIHPFMVVAGLAFLAFASWL